MILVLVFAFSLITLWSQVSDKITGTGNLTVIVSGFENDKGQLKIVLFNSKETYSNNLNEPFISGLVNIKDKKAIWVFENIPFGEYAIKCYHDENGNNELDKNILGIPKEKYGFSNNANGSFGIPDYEKTKFVFNPEMENIVIIVK